jgi:hypothetical protein
MGRRGQLSEATDVVLAVVAWHGPKARDHDFAADRQAFEVKSNTAKHSRIIITSLEQLNDADLTALYLIYVPLRKSDLPAHSLLQLGEELLSKANEIAGLRARLFSKMIGGGWAKATEEQKQTTCFRRTVLRAFHVKTGFPRILKDDMKRFGPAVSINRYKVDLAQCREYEQPSEEFAGLLKSLRPADSAAERIDMASLLEAHDEAETDENDDEGTD